MITFTKPLAKLIAHFERFPGIGPRTAQRLALYILKQPEQAIKDFSKALLELIIMSDIARNVLILLLKRSAKYVKILIGIKK